jgi:hypothetical protein
MKLSVALMVLSIIGQVATATKGDVERAVELLKQARAAIGGEAAVGSVQSLSINGRTHRQLQLPNQELKQLNGEFELSMILPDRMIRIEKLTHGTAEASERVESDERKESKVKDVQVKVVRHKGDGHGEKAARHHEQAEIARFMVGLLLTPPSSVAATSNYIGEGNVDGARADIIEMTGANGFTMKLYLDRSSHLPLMMSYKGSLPRIPIEKHLKGDGTTVTNDEKDVVIVRHKTQGESSEGTPNVIFERKLKDGDVPAEGRKVVIGASMLENAEIQIRFSDFRAVSGVLLPHTMTHFVNGNLDAVWTVEKYEVNSPSIHDRFRNEIEWRSQQN